MSLQYQIKTKNIMETTIVKTVLSDNEEILITAIAIKELLSDNYKVYCSYRYTYNSIALFDNKETETDQFKNAFYKIQNWCHKKGYTLWDY